MNDIELRSMVEDEVDYKGLPKELKTIDKALEYIKNSNRLMELLDLVVEEAISAVTNKGAST